MLLGDSLDIDAFSTQDVAVMCLVYDTLDSHLGVLEGRNREEGGSRKGKGGGGGDEGGRR